MRRLLLLFPLLLLVGCSSHRLNLTRYEPNPAPPYQRVMIEKGGDEGRYLIYQSNRYKIKAALYAYNQIIVLPLTISNGTGSRILPEEYCVALYDGRDYKELHIVKRDTISRIKATYQSNGKGAGAGLMDAAAQVAFNAVVDIFSPATKDMVVKALNQIEDQYFSFRPIWAHEKRYGVLAFVHDFQLEFPLTLVVKVKDEKAGFRFGPPLN
ncbi:MAG: hypothetical protein U9R38_03815 [Candidatus Margulisiibacteriota bacterium]|nr:hypothetical protein [Candidatus Margulisiibacteriota bacterium]